MYLVHTKPFSISKINKQEIFNELTIFLESYHCICITDFVEDAETKVIVGWSMIAVVVINLLFGVVSLLLSTSRQIKMNIHR
jgi:hypothetical protein